MASAGPIDLPAPSGRAEAALNIDDAAAAGHSRRRRVVTFTTFAIAVLVTWEAVKWIGGVPWRFHDVLGTGLAIDHAPPFRFPFASDLNLPL